MREYVILPEYNPTLIEKKQVYNPYLPCYEYVPNGELYVFGGRLYIFGRHDRFNGSEFCMNHYVGWSAPVNDLGDWHCEGIIYDKRNDPLPEVKEGILKSSYPRHEKLQGNRIRGAWLFEAPSVRKYNGQYYLIYSSEQMPELCYAISDRPTEGFVYGGTLISKGIQSNGSKIVLYILKKR